MKLEEYCERGYHYADYLQMNQWQRARCAFRSRPRAVHIDLALRFTRWEWGFGQSQEFEYYNIGPLCIWWHC